jgi:lysophospholipase L1-like esterase
MPRVLCYGDSNTWGSATVPRPDGRYAWPERWPGILAARLGPSWMVIEEGLPGRTTVHSDPIEGAWLNGASYLVPCLRSHRPLDVVVIMLGTNDLKARCGVTPFDIAEGVGTLLTILRQAEAGNNAGMPKAMVVCPPPIRATFGELPEFGDMFEAGHEKSLRLKPQYERVAKLHGAYFLDAGSLITSSAFDGIHLDADMHMRLGEAIAVAIKGMGPFAT